MTATDPHLFLIMGLALVFVAAGCWLIEVLDDLYKKRADERIARPSARGKYPRKGIEGQK